MPVGFPKFLGGNGLLRVFNNSELDELSRREDEARRGTPEPILQLAAHIRKAFEAAVNHRQSAGVTERLLKCQRQRMGVYEPEKAQAIREQGGSDLYFNLTETKCSAAEAWISDVLSPAGDKPWTLEPTPIADLAEALKQQLIERVMMEFQAQLGAGMPPTGPEIFTRTLELYDDEVGALQEEAAKRARRMEQKIYDQLIEGGFSQAFETFVRDLCTYPLGILKGPVVRKEKRTAWVKGQVQVVDEVIPTWTAVSPHDFYPGPHCADVDSSYICERITFDKAELSAMRGVEGWNAREIEAVLSEGTAAPVAAILPGESSRADMESRPHQNSAEMPDAVVEAVEFWGCASGDALAEWGMGEVEDRHAYYDIHAILIGSHVVKAVKNPDPLGRRPYFATSYERVSNSIWGRSIPERMNDCQDASNGCLRNLINNLALASGPQVAIDVDALDATVDAQIYPWKVWQYHGRKIDFSRQPAIFFQPSANVDQLLKAADYFEIKSDDRTLIPRYTHGSEQGMGGAGETASGLSMLLNSAAKGIKHVIANIDRDVIRPLIERIYVWNLLYLPDGEFGNAKGDCRIVPRGAMAMLVREQLQVRRQEFLDRTNNPTDLQIVGVEGRANLLRVVAEDLGTQPGEVVPSKEELIRRLQREMMSPEQEPGGESEKEAKADAA